MKVLFITLSLHVESEALTRAGRKKPQLPSCVVTLTLVSPLIFTRACRQKLKSVEEPSDWIHTDVVF